MGAKKNKEFILKFINSLSGIHKTREQIEEYVTDKRLIEHFLFFDSVFPENEMLIDEITTDGNRVIFRSRLKGKHKGEINGVPPTFRKVEFPIVFGFEIENEKIVHHWLISDQALLMEQMGVTRPLSDIQTN